MRAAREREQAYRTLRLSSSASCAISGSGKRGARAFRHRPAGRNDPRSVARRPLPRLRKPNRSWRSAPPETSGSAQVRSRTPCSAAPSPPAAVCLTSGAHFCHSAPMETHAFGFRLRANAPEGRFPISDRLRLSVSNGTQPTSVQTGTSFSRKKEKLRDFIQAYYLKHRHLPVGDLDVPEVGVVAFSVPPS